jgi:hypothetical protein
MTDITFKKASGKGPIALLVLLCTAIAWLSSSELSAKKPDSFATNDSTHLLSPYFTPSTVAKLSPDPKGFIQRWLLLEPIVKPNRGNTVFTDSYLRQAFYTEYFDRQFSILPRDGEQVTAGQQTMTWHALDSKLFNVKLFRFAYGLKKPYYGVLFWAVTVVYSPQEMENVRLAVGSNSASMWWLNDKEVLLLSGDRRMVVDDAVSARLTLHKGRNVLRGAVINGPGMSDFCLRFLDKKGQPVRNLTIGHE